MGMPAKIASSIGRKTLFSAGNLDEDVGPLSPRKQALRRLQGLAGIVGKKRRNLEGNPPINRIGPVIDGPEQVGCAVRSSMANSKKSSSPAFPALAFHEWVRHRQCSS